MNVIPRDAAAWLDVRTIPGVDHAAVVEAIGARAAAAGRDAGVVGSVTVIDDRPAVSTPATSPVVTALCEAHTAVTGQPARLGGVGATDGTVLTSRTGMPTVVYGPGGRRMRTRSTSSSGRRIIEARGGLPSALRFLSAAGR